MNTLRLCFSALGASLALIPGGGEKIAFHPEAGSSVTKTFTSGGEFELDDMSLIVSGQDVGDMIGQFEITVKMMNTVQVTDAYQAVADGRPTALLRTFDSLAGKFEMEVSAAEGGMPEMESSSPLEGKTVAFKWNAEKGEYERSFHESEGDAELLEGLDEDMDLRVFLPESEVAEASTWTVELSQLMHLMSPGGNLSLAPEQMPDDEGMEKLKEIFAGMEEKFGELFEGECKCTFKGVRDEGGERVAEIFIELEAAATIDLTEVLTQVIDAALEQNDVGGEVQIDLETADLNLDFDGEGTLLWNLKAGRMHAFQISGDTTIEMDLAVAAEAEGQSQDMDATFRFSGTMHEEVALEE